MTSLKKRGFYLKIYSLLPLIVLFVSVLNEFDLNYLKLDYFSFNFPYILIFFFTLKDFKNFDYLLVFLAGLINANVASKLAEDPELTIKACFAPMNFAKAFSKFLVILPIVIFFENKTFAA